MQTIVGVLPTFLTTAGLFALCALAVARVRSRPELVLVPLLPLVALAGTLYYAYSYPSVDADTVKALYLLPAVPAFAVCFGFAVETLWRRSRWLGIAIVVPARGRPSRLTCLRSRMSTERSDRLEWVYFRLALVVAGVLVIADVGAWKVHDFAYPRPTRLERTVFCLSDNKGVIATVPAGDPLADSARAGSLRTTIEGNEVTVALAKSEGEAMKLEQYYRAVGGDLTGQARAQGPLGLPVEVRLLADAAAGDVRLSVLMFTGRWRPEPTARRSTRASARIRRSSRRRDARRAVSAPSPR